MKGTRLSRFVMHTYMLASIAAVVLMFTMLGTPEDIFLAVGSSSWVIAFGLFTSSTVGTQIVVLIMGLWFFVFPVILLFFYILAWVKNSFLPFCVITTIDTIFVVVWTIACLVTRNMYAFNETIMDAVISILISTFFLVSVRKQV